MRGDHEHNPYFRGSAFRLGTFSDNFCSLSGHFRGLTRGTLESDIAMHDQGVPYNKRLCYTVPFAQKIIAFWVTLGAKRRHWDPLGTI